MTLPHDATLDATHDSTIRDADGPNLRGVPWPGRLWACIFAARYDKQVEHGVHPAEGSPLAAHCARLASRHERRALEQTLTNVLLDADVIEGGRAATARVPIQADAVRQSTDLVRDVIARLASPLPLHRRGVARLRVLLSDGRGPLYRRGPGTLAAALRGVLAAL